MKSIKKKLIALFTIGALSLVTATSAFAISVSSTPGYILGWNGQSTAPLRGHGVSQPLRVGTDTSSSSAAYLWTVELAPHGNYMISAGNAGYCVNIYRVLQYGSYYLATGYPYENATSGRDQRVVLPGSNWVRLASPLVNGNWYLTADTSNPSTNSAVLWCSSTSGIRSQWA